MTIFLRNSLLQSHIDEILNSSNKVISKKRKIDDLDDSTPLEVQTRKKRRIGLDSSEEVKKSHNLKESESEGSMIEIPESIVEDDLSKISNTPVTSNNRKGKNKKLSKQTHHRRLKRMEEVIAERHSIG